MLKRCVKSLKPVAISVALVWFLLLGIAFAEDLGLLRDTFENGDQQIEQVLSTDIIKGARASDYARLVLLSPATVPSLSALHLLCVSPRSCTDIGESIIRMRRDFKLYLLHSIYLI